MRTTIEELYLYFFNLLKCDSLFILNCLIRVLFIYSNKKKSLLDIKIIKKYFVFVFFSLVVVDNYYYKDLLRMSLIINFICEKRI